jgi:hypothetical protein
MKAVIYDWYTDIFLNDQEAMTFCKPGKMADTCVWLLLGEQGFECCYYHKHPSLLERWEKGLTSAKRDGCERVKNFHPIDHGEGEIEF